MAKLNPNHKFSFIGFILFYIFAIGSINAQTVVKGVVKDSSSLAPLQNASINLNYGEVVTHTDSYGNFEIMLAKASNTITIKFIGYKPFRATLSNKSNIFLEVKLLQVANDLEDVLVTSKGAETNSRKPLLGINTLSLKTLTKIPAAMGELDILRGLQLLPGVTSVGEAANGVNIRGGSTDQNLILLDDAPIFNPTHLFGLFSAFPSDAVSNIDLYKGSVPSKYGGRAAAVLDVSLQNPTLTEFKISGGISFVSNRIKIDVPLIKDKMGIILSGRGSFNDFLFPLISDRLKETKANFGDYSLKYFWKINSKNTISFSNYFSYDFFQTELLGTINDINSTNTQFKYQTFNQTLTWFRAINKNVNFQTKLIKSNYNPQTILPELGSENKVRIKSDIGYLQAKSNINYSKNNNLLELGIDAIRYDINPGELDPGTSDIEAQTTNKEHGNEFALYLEDEVVLIPKLTVRAGVRYSYFQNVGAGSYRTYQEGEPRNELSLIDTIQFGKGETNGSFGGLEPRIGIKYQLDPKKSFKIGYNLMRQYLQIVTNTTTPLPTSRWKTSDNYIKPQVSSLYSIGYFHETPSGIYEFSLESYLRDVKNIVDYRPGADFLLQQYPESQILQGKNRSYGFEFMISKKKGEFKGWANYTFSRSQNLINEGPQNDQKINNGNWYNANYDRPHSVNITTIFNQGKHHDFSFNFTYSTGRPFTMPQGFISYQDRVYPFYTLRNNARLPDYHRLDFSWNIYNPKMNEKRRFKGNWNFTVYNLYGRKNAYSIFLKSNGNAIEPQKLIIFGTPIPSLAYNFTFK
ncbi:MAG: TonB-dependent receptor [Leadbetterella sp.]